MMMMDLSKENQLAVVVSKSQTSVPELLCRQKELLDSQIDQLQHIVGRQCKLTGVNPLSQEMAAGALSIKIGKRPRDLLNPKALKYMQLIFSIKDAISKKDSREISALFGLTATQVQEFFASQRTRVRRFVRLSKDKPIRPSLCEEAEDGPSTSDSSIPIHPIPLNFVGPTISEGPSCSTQDEFLPGMDDSDKQFIASIFDNMRKEETFSGQVKLLDWILQMKNPSVLHWFLTKGGVMILATWLGQAATEEQTSVLHVILQVLCHLPLNSAIPAHMSAILQSVNKLRFYRTLDISNRAKTLLGRWSKMFARSQAMKKPGSVVSAGDAQDEMLLKQSIGEIMGNESWESKTDSDGALITLDETMDNSKNLRTSQPMKLLMASTDDSNKKLLRGGSSSHKRAQNSDAYVAIWRVTGRHKLRTPYVSTNLESRERRKVQMVEQPGQKAAGKSPQVARSVPATKGRPLSADDIQKAKMRAQFMQNKYGKSLTSASSESPQLKIEAPSPSSSPQASILPSTTKSLVQPKVEEHKNLMKSVPKIVSNQPKATFQKRVSPDLEEPLWKKCKRFQVTWLTPPAFEIDGSWSVGTGENSKEVEFQNNRIRREKEIFYKTPQDIPPNPKEPWDREMEYDDSLTPEIPLDQLPDNDIMETESTQTQNPEPGTSNGSNPGPSQNSNGNMLGPDLDLLTVLLKNPGIVFALTSGQGGNLTSEQTVKLLDMIKSNGVDSVNSLITGLSVDQKAEEEEKVEVSLPSPTPSSNPVPSGWRSEIAKNPFSHGNVTVNGEAYAIPGVSVQEKLPTTGLMHHPQFPVNSVVVSHPSPAMPSSTRRHTTFHAASSTFSNGQLQLRASDTVQNMSSPSWPDSLPGPSHRQTQMHSPVISEPHLSAHSWRGKGSAVYPQVNHSNNYNVYGGPEAVAQLPMQQQPGPHWERNGYRYEQAGFDYGSGNNSNSPTRYQEGWNQLEGRMNYGPSYRPEMGRPRDSSGYRDHGGENGNGRWYDRRR